MSRLALLVCIVVAFIDTANARAEPPPAKTDRVVQCQEVIPVSAEELFSGFTNSEGIIKLWGVGQAEVDFRVGGQIRTRYDKAKKLGDPGTIVNTILAFEPGRMLAIKPTAPEGAPDWLKLICSTGWSVLRLEPVDESHTRLTITGMGYGDGPDYDKAYDFFDKGNRWTLEHLKAEFTGEKARPSGEAHKADPKAPAPVRPIDASLFVASGMVEQQIVKEATINTTPAGAFKAWTTSDGLKSWLGVDNKLELRVGGPMELYFGPDNSDGKRGSEGCQILSYVPDRMLSFSWNAPPKLPAAREKRTWVVITFTPAGDHDTNVRLVHTGFGDGGEWPQVKEYFEKAWGNVLQAMTKHFEETAKTVGSQ